MMQAGLRLRPGATAPPPSNPRRARTALGCCGRSRTCRRCSCSIPSTRSTKPAGRTLAERLHLQLTEPPVLDRNELIEELKRSAELAASEADGFEERCFSLAG